MEQFYVEKRIVKAVVRDLNKYGLKGLSRQLREKKKVTYAELMEYVAKIRQVSKKETGIAKTEWEEKIVVKLGRPD